MAEPSSAAADYIIEARFPSTVGFHAALSSVRPGNDQGQVCLVQFAADGLTMKWEHQKSKAMQSGIFLGHALFSSYSLRRGTSFAVSLTTLLDTLAAIASGDMGELTIRYPGPDAELLLESADQPLPQPEEGPSAGAETAAVPCIYARVSTMESLAMSDLLEHFSEPFSYIIGPGPLLKEAIDDMEWTGAAITVEMVRDPPRLAVSSSKGNLSLEVEIPVRQLSSLSCCAPSVRWQYKFDLLRAAFANVASHRGGDAGAVSKLAIDEQGLMKITHMLKVPAAADDVGESAPHPLASGAYAAGGGGSATPRIAVVQIGVMALWEDGGESGDDAEPAVGF